MPNSNASVRYFRTRLPLFPAFRRWVWERANGNASVRYFRTTLPLSPRIGGGYGRESEQRCFRPAVPDNTSPIPAHRRRIRERTNSNASVRHFRPTLPLLRASAAGTEEGEQRCFRPAFPANASPTPRFCGGYGGERTTMFPSGGSGQRFPYSPRISGGYGRERTAMPPSGGSGQRFPCTPRFGGGYGRERTAMSLLAGSGRGLN